MEWIEHFIVAALLLLLAVVLSGWLARTMRSRVPLPLVQIGPGGLLAAGTDLGLRLDPEIFFLLFLPPLLFFDGWRIPTRRARGLPGAVGAQDPDHLLPTAAAEAQLGRAEEPVDDQDIPVDVDDLGFAIGA